MRFLILVTLLAGCVSVSDRPMAAGGHEIATATGFPNNYSGAAIALDARADELCPAGYEKTAERKSGVDLVWTIRCD